MNLRNNEITVGEILQNPKAKALLQREAPKLAKNPMLPMSYAIPLKDVLTYSKGVVPQFKVKQILSQLEKM